MEKKFSKDSLQINPEEVAEELVEFMKTTVFQDLRRFGGVLGISGGVDSSVVLALSVRAFGPERVAAIIMPEQDSDPDSQNLATRLAEHFGVSPVVESMTPPLDGFRCYERRDDAIRRVFPDFDAAKGYKSKIVLPQDVLESGSLNMFQLAIITPDGEEKSARLRPKEFYQIVAASNFKQRSRMAMLYYHAELRNYAVVGTPNKNEHAQGFFVKYGDGGVDLRPIVHLYKSQVYQLAEYLELPEEIISRPPTSDTYSAPSTQEEFFFRLPFQTMDLLWYARENGIPVEETAEVMGLSADQVRNAFADFERKQRTTEYLRRPAIELTG